MHKKRLDVIGVGSPYGDDHVAYEIVSQLAQKNTFRSLTGGLIHFSYHDRPGARLLNLINKEATLILIDAVVSGKTIGSIISLSNHKIESHQQLISSHHMAIPEALALGRALNQLPNHILFFGIEIDPNRVSPEVKAAIPKLINLVESTIITLCDD